MAPSPAEGQTTVTVSTFAPEELLALTRPCVYAFVYKGRVLYIGSSVNGMNRFASTSHRHRKVMEHCERVRVFWCQSEREARSLEERLIRTLHPPFNNERLKQGPNPRWKWQPEILAFITESLLFDRVELDKFVESLKDAA